MTMAPAGERCKIEEKKFAPKTKKALIIQGFFTGGISRTRTYDPHDVKSGINCSQIN